MSKPMVLINENKPSSTIFNGILETDASLIATRLFVNRQGQHVYSFIEEKKDGQTSGSQITKDDDETLSISYCEDDGVGYSIHHVNINTSQQSYEVDTSNLPVSEEESSAFIDRAQETYVNLIGLLKTAQFEGEGAETIAQSTAEIVSGIEKVYLQANNVQDSVAPEA